MGTHGYVVSWVHMGMWCHGYTSVCRVMGTHGYMVSWVHMGIWCRGYTWVCSIMGSIVVKLSQVIGNIY